MANPRQRSLNPVQVYLRRLTQELWCARYCGHTFRTWRAAASSNRRLRSVAAAAVGVYASRTLSQVGVASLCASEAASCS